MARKSNETPAIELTSSLQWDDNNTPIVSGSSLTLNMSERTNMTERVNSLASHGENVIWEDTISEYTKRGDKFSEIDGDCIEVSRSDSDQ